VVSETAAWRQTSSTGNLDEDSAVKTHDNRLNTHIAFTLQQTGHLLESIKVQFQRVYTERSHADDKELWYVMFSKAAPLNASRSPLNFRSVHLHISVETTVYSRVSLVKAV
jgi:hypothetical protein